MTKTNQILFHCEKGFSLFRYSDDEIKEALDHSTRDIHRYELTRELTYREKMRKPSTVNGMTNVKRKNRCPTGWTWEIHIRDCLNEQGRK